MSEKKYKKKYEFQKKMIARQSSQIEDLKSKVEELRLECDKKDMIINSVEQLRKELADNVNDAKQKNKEYEKLIKELKTMKNIINKDVYKGRWWLVKFLLK